MIDFIWFLVWFVALLSMLYAGCVVFAVIEELLIIFKNNDKKTQHKEVT